MIACSNIANCQKNKHSVRTYICVKKSIFSLFLYVFEFFVKKHLLWFYCVKKVLCELSIRRQSRPLKPFVQYFMFAMKSFWPKALNSIFSSLVILFANLISLFAFEINGFYFIQTRRLLVEIKNRSNIFLSNYIRVIIFVSDQICFMIIPDVSRLFPDANN